MEGGNSVSDPSLYALQVERIVGRPDGIELVPSSLTELLPSCTVDSGYGFPFDQKKPFDSRDLERGVG